MGRPNHLRQARAKRNDSRELVRCKAAIRHLREKQRALKVNAVYLLRRADQRLEWFGEPQLVAKVGRSSRSPFQRRADLRSRSYELVAYWAVAREDLPRAELTALHAMKAVFGVPCDGREAFYIDTMEHAYAVVAASIASYVTHAARGERHDQPILLPAAFPGNERDPIRTLNLASRSPVASFQHRIGTATTSSAIQQRGAGDDIRPARKARGRCVCGECRKADVQKSLF